MQNDNGADREKTGEASVAVLRAFLDDGTIADIPYWFDDKSQERGEILLSLLGEFVVHIAIVPGEVHPDGEFKCVIFKGDITAADVKTAWDVSGGSNKVAAAYLGIEIYQLKYLRKKYRIDCNPGCGERVYVKKDPNEKEAINADDEK